MSATLAAGVAVGVAVVLARTTRDRRASPLTGEERRLGLQPGEPPLDGLQRMALGQIDIALEQLQRASGMNAATAVHETRKALKRLRALLRLLERELGASTYAREDAAVRDIARRLSGARDAQVMLDTLDALIERHPRKLARRKGVRRLRRALLRDRERMERQALGEGAALEQALAQLRDLRGRVAAWRAPERDATKLVDRGLRDLYAQGRKGFRRAYRKQGKDVHAMHRWRKRVKDLRYAAEMLERRPRAQEKRRGASARLRRLAERADVLAEILGEDHDLAMLAERVRAEAKPHSHRRKKPQRVGRATRKTLLKLIARRRLKLQARALREGAHLYRRGAKRFARRLRR
ncbi:MAG TPA: CHAD domain-containing protein [Solirubrobacteraceae bacterium]|nr:CHAD domain-containing protein [Solirubrobacteraceae bacterium]